MSDRYSNIYIEPESISKLTRRELFAAMAMQGLVSTYSIYRDEMPTYTANAAVKFADALVAALEEDES